MIERIAPNTYDQMNHRRQYMRQHLGGAGIWRCCQEQCNKQARSKLGRTLTEQQKKERGTKGPDQ